MQQTIINLADLGTYFNTVNIIACVVATLTTVMENVHKSNTLRYNLVVTLLAISLAGIIVDYTSIGSIFIAILIGIISGMISDDLLIKFTNKFPNFIDSVLDLIFDSVKNIVNKWFNK